MILFFFFFFFLSPPPQHVLCIAGIHGAVRSLSCPNGVGMRRVHHQHDNAIETLLHLFDVFSTSFLHISTRNRFSMVPGRYCSKNSSGSQSAKKSILCKLSKRQDRQ